MQIDLVDAAREMEVRRKVRGSLESWCRHCGYEPARHHRLILERLEAVSRGEIKRLGLFLPPGSAKSTYASVLFPPWYLANRRDAALICASHTDTLAATWGRRARNLIAGQSSTLGLELSPDVQAAGQWETLSGGEFFAAGVGGSLPGRRADLLIIDDPVRNREDADSETIRSKQWDWWLFDALPRLKPNASVILIMTRWHHDDLAGRLLEHEKQAWVTVTLPMEAHSNDPLGRRPGERLWPEWFTDGMVSEAKRDGRVWSALYQQEPTPETGDYFQRKWLRKTTRMPHRRELNVYGGSDYATTSKGGDFTCHIVIGVDEHGDLYLLDIWRKQATSDEWVEAWCDLVRLWRPSRWAEEMGQISAGVGPFLKQRAKQRRAFTFRMQFPSKHDKAVRAQSIRGRMSMSGLTVPAGAPWLLEFESELMAFPAGRHDDQVDALGLVGQLLDVIIDADPKPAPKDLQNPTGYSAWRKEPEISQRGFAAIDL